MSHGGGERLAQIWERSALGNLKDSISSIVHPVDYPQITTIPIISYSSRISLLSHDSNWVGVGKKLPHFFHYDTSLGDCTQCRGM